MITLLRKLVPIVWTPAVNAADRRCRRRRRTKLWVYYSDAPWTRDGRVRADVVTIAPDVAGLVTEVLVRDNQTVKRGDVLFQH